MKMQPGCLVRSILNQFMCLSTVCMSKCASSQLDCMKQSTSHAWLGRRGLSAILPFHCTA